MAGSADVSDRDDFLFGEEGDKDALRKAEADFVILCVPGTFARQGKKAAWFDGGEFVLADPEDGLFSEEEKKKAQREVLDKIIADGLEQAAVARILERFFCRRGDRENHRPIKIRVETLNWFQRRERSWRNLLYAKKETLQQVARKELEAFHKARGTNPANRRDEYETPEKSLEDKLGKRLGGGPSFRDRNDGAAHLAKRLAYWTINRETPCVILAHSHGGNIAIEATRRLALKTFCKPAAFQRLRSIVTVGSPLFVQPHNLFRHALFGIPFLPGHFAVWASLAIATITLWVAQGEASWPVEELVGGDRPSLPWFVTRAGLFALGFMMTTTLWASFREWLFSRRAAKNLRLTNIYAPEDEVAQLFPQLAGVKPSKGMTSKMAGFEAVMKLRGIFRGAVIAGLINLTLVLIARLFPAGRPPATVSSETTGLVAVCEGLCSAIGDLVLFLASFADENPFLSYSIALFGVSIPLLMRLTDFLVGKIPPAAFIRNHLLGWLQAPPSLFDNAVAQFVYGSKNTTITYGDLCRAKNGTQLISRCLPPEVRNLVSLVTVGGGLAMGSHLRDALDAVRGNVTANRKVARKSGKRPVQARAKTPVKPRRNGLPEDRTAEASLRVSSESSVDDEAIIFENARVARIYLTRLLGSEGLFHNAYFKSAAFRFYLALVVAKAMDFDVRLRDPALPEGSSTKHDRPIDSKAILRIAARRDEKRMIDSLLQVNRQTLEQSDELDIDAVVETADVASWSGARLPEPPSPFAHHPPLSRRQRATSASVTSLR